MTAVELIILLVIAGVAGAVGQSLGGYKQGGFLLAIVLGFIGAFIGAWLARSLGLPVVLPITVAGIAFPVIWAIIGAAILVGLFGLIGRGHGYRWGVTPPTRPVLAISVLLAVLALLVYLGVIIIPFSTLSLLVAAYVLLLVGNLVRRL